VVPDLPERTTAVIGSFRAVFKDIFIYGSGDALARASGLLTLPIYTRLLTTRDYGALGFVLSAQVLFISLLAVGSDAAYARFYFAEETVEARRVVTSTWFAFLTVWSCVLTAIVIPFSGVLSKSAFGTTHYELLVTLALISTPVTLMNNMFGQVLRNEFRAKLFTVLNAATVLLTAAFGIGGVVLGLGVNGIIGGMLVAGVVLMPVRIWTARHMLGWHMSRKLLEQLVRFGAPLLPASLAYWVFELSDRIVLGKLSSLSQVALYTVAIAITSGLALLVGAVGQAWSPHSLHVYEHRPGEAPAYFGQMLTYILVGFGLVSVLITAFAPELVAVLAPHRYHRAAEAVAPLALSFVAYASVQVTAISMTITKKTQYVLVFAWVAAILNLVLNLVFVPAGGMLASAWATFASYLCLTLGYFVVSQRLWPVSYERGRTLTAIVLTTVFTLAATAIPEHPLGLMIPLKIVYCGLFAMLLVKLHAIDTREFGAVADVLGESRLTRALGRRLVTRAEGRT
jgi:O-antigen/teichoic acid export membrane protein